MSKIPFDIKFRPQIESGEYKVVTGDDMPVRILSWDKKVFGGRYEIVALIPASQGDTETVQLYCPDGTLISSDWNEKFKLFIVTPEPELTEFEQAIKMAIIDYERNKDNGFTMDYCVGKHAARILELARKELDKEYEELRWAKDIALRTEYEKGRADTLKDLPRWKKCPHASNGIGNIYSGRDTDSMKVCLIMDGYCIDIKELIEKLPKDE